MLLWAIAYSVVLVTTLSPFVLHGIKGNRAQKLIQEDGIQIETENPFPLYHPAKLAKFKVKTIFTLVIIVPLISSFFSNVLPLPLSPYTILFHVMAGTVVALGLEFFFKFRKDLQVMPAERIIYSQVVTPAFDVYVKEMEKKGRKNLVAHRIFKGHTYVDYGTIEYYHFRLLYKDIRDWTFLHLLNQIHETLALIADIDGEQLVSPVFEKQIREKLALVETRIETHFENLRHPTSLKAPGLMKVEHSSADRLDLENYMPTESPELIELKNVLKEDLPMELREKIQHTINEIYDKQSQKEKEAMETAKIMEVEAMVKAARMMNGIEDKKGE